MVGQEILVLFIMVRIRAPQPKIQPAFCRFNFWFWTARPIFLSVFTATQQEWPYCFFYIMRTRVFV